MVTFSENELLMIVLLLDKEEEEQVKTKKKRKWVHRAWKRGPTERKFATLYTELMDNEAVSFFIYISECQKIHSIYFSLFI